MRRKPLRKILAESPEVSPLNTQGLQSDFLQTLDESPEFHDPYSELNLFLSQKIKQEIRHCSHPKKWSAKLQSELLHKISPEFQKKFPKYHLGVSALKTTWEKVNYFSNQIQNQRHALTQDGKLNTSFFIKENLKSARKIQNVCHLHPYHYAHQLALKMSECIAIVDGIRPKLEELAKRIWAVQRHLIPQLVKEHYMSPYDENDQIDRLIVKTILEITAKQPQVSQAELASKVEIHLKTLKEWPSSCNPLQLKNCICALFSEKIATGKKYSEKQLNKAPFALIQCMEGEMASRLIDHPDLRDHQVTSLVFESFKKNRTAIENTSEEEIERKIYNWTMQSDMIMRWIRFDQTSPLYHQIQSHWKKNALPLEEFVQSQLLIFLKHYPNLSGFALKIKWRIWTLLKSLWYTEEYTGKTTTFDRFIKWHTALGLSTCQIQQLCKTALPLMPFDLSYVRTLIGQEEEKKTKDNQRKT